MKDGVRGMIKRIACALTVVFLMLCCVSCARTQEEPSGARPEQELVSAVTDLRELAMIAERDNIDAPPGYRLEKWRHIRCQVGDCRIYKSPGHTRSYTRWGRAAVVRSDFMISASMIPIGMRGRARCR